MKRFRLFWPLYSFLECRLTFTHRRATLPNVDNILRTLAHIRETTRPFLELDEGGEVGDVLSGPLCEGEAGLGLPVGNACPDGVSLFGAGDV